MTSEEYLGKDNIKDHAIYFLSLLRKELNNLPEFHRELIFQNLDAIYGTRIMGDAIDLAIKKLPVCDVLWEKNGKHDLAEKGRYLSDLLIKIRDAGELEDFEPAYLLIREVVSSILRKNQSLNKT